MNSTRSVALVLIVAGILSLVYGGFSYTKETHQAKLGSLELSIKDKKTVSIPMWVGAASLIGGVVLLVARPKS